MNGKIKKKKFIKFYGTLRRGMYLYVSIKQCLLSLYIEIKEIFESHIENNQISKIDRISIIKILQF